MISTSQGTLEGVGPNPSGTTSAPCSYLNYNSMGANASTNPSTPRGSLDSVGLNSGALGASSAGGLVNAIDTSNDTSMLAVPEAGTVESSMDVWR